MDKFQEKSINITTFEYAPNLLPCFRKQLPTSQSLTKPMRCRHPGFMIELLMQMLTSAPSHWKLKTATFYPTNDHGAQLSNETWSGMIGELMAHRADISLPGITPTPAREKVVGFIYPELAFTPICFIVNPKQYISQVDLIKSMHPLAWVGFFILYLMMAGLVLASAWQRRASQWDAFNQVYCMSFVQDDKSSRKSVTTAVLSIFWTFFVTRTLFIALASTLFYQSQMSIPLPRSYWDLPRFMKNQEYKLMMFRSNWYYTQMMTSLDAQFVAIRNFLSTKNFEIMQERRGKPLISALSTNPGSISYWDCYVAMDQIRTSGNSKMLSQPIRNEVIRNTIAYSRNLSSLVVNNLTKIAQHFIDFGLVKHAERKYFASNHGHTLKNEPQILSMKTFMKTFIQFFVLFAMCIGAFVIETMIGPDTPKQMIGTAKSMR